MSGFPTVGYAATDSSVSFKPITFERHAVGEHDVHIAIEFCGICHTDLHFVKNDMGNTVYPCVPGHEIVGKVDQVRVERSDSGADTDTDTDATPAIHPSGGFQRHQVQSR